MYRLLIVDDEEIITDSLYETFVSHMPERLDVCKAYSAKEALTWMERSRIDIVLTDIRMPGMSGLELTEQIQAYWSHCRVIFLTGYSDFNYAYKAFQMPNVRYLLKTEGYDKIMAVVEEVMQEIRQSHRMHELLQQSHEVTCQLAELQQEEYLRNLLQNCTAYTAGSSEIQDEWARRDIGLHFSAPVYVVVGRLDYKDKPLHAERAQIQASTRKISSSLLDEHTYHASVADHYGDVVWLIQSKQPEAEPAHSLVRYLEGTLELVQEACMASLGISVAFALSGKSCNWSDITRQYERLRQLHWMKIGDGISMVLTDHEDALPHPDHRELTRVSSRIEVMSGYLETGRIQQFYEVFEELVNELLQQDVTMERAMETYYNLALHLYSTINRWGLHQDIPDQRRLLRLSEYSSMKDAVQVLYQATDKLVRFKNLDEQERANAAIHSLCTYIKEHLEEDLSLVRLAELHHFNPSYLSRFFKQEMGINLSEFIDELKVRRSKELLRNSDLMVREVALQVGYEAAHSFTRFFKKVTGMTPQEFRESLLVR
ncbi:MULTISPECIES: response regulator transcription factor [Paenibacillus]|uniref:Two-component system response regulator YesN n=1 Tax=Paenibacillus pabuli TaxID=1472 RepID=A0A855XPL1_9BACL|nr:MULTISPECIES: response regulator [Paenibacillus]PWW36199.1 two-component system response regulator YesN [Paenibacillus pabuli]PXW03278.1 two-component system response regulator YesN [Paenibacillus taichungensis]